MFDDVLFSGEYVSKDDVGWRRNLYSMLHEEYRERTESSHAWKRNFLSLFLFESVEDKIYELEIALSNKDPEAWNNWQQAYTDLRESEWVKRFDWSDFEKYGAYHNDTLLSKDEWDSLKEDKKKIYIRDGFVSITREYFQYEKDRLINKDIRSFYFWSRFIFLGYRIIKLVEQNLEKQWDFICNLLVEVSDEKVAEILEYEKAVLAIHFQNMELSKELIRKYIQADQPAYYWTILKATIIAQDHKDIAVNILKELLNRHDSKEVELKIWKAIDRIKSTFESQQKVIELEF